MAALRRSFIAVFDERNLVLAAELLPIIRRGAMTEAAAFLAGLELTPHDRQPIAHGNAERVLTI